MQRIFVFSVCLFLCVGLFAQKTRFNQSFGLGATIGDVSGTANFVDSTVSTRSSFTLRVKTYGIVYTPRIDLIGSKDFSVSIAFPMMLGLSTTNNYRSVDKRTPGNDTTVEGLRGAYLAFAIPAFVDFNFGLHSASDETRRKFGVFVGAGYTYNYTKIKTTAGKIPYDKWEPVLRAGMRMGESWEKRWSLVFSLSGKFESGAAKTYGLQILKEL